MSYLLSKRYYRDDIKADLKSLATYDTIVFLDYPLEVCLKGVESRIGKPRPDIPWKEDVFDLEFKQWIIDWFKNTRPWVLHLINKYQNSKDIVILHSREEGDAFVRSLSPL